MTAHREITTDGPRQTAQPCDCPETRDHFDTGVPVLTVSPWVDAHLTAVQGAPALLDRAFELRGGRLP